MKIYVDMDGVLTNFEDAARDLGQGQGLRPDATEEEKNQMYRAIDEAGASFWANMKWTQDGKKLWNALRKLNPVLLSSPAQFRGAPSGKLTWVNREIPGTSLFLENQKSSYADRDSVLIDDMLKNVLGWRECGGVGIHHKDTDTTLAELRDILNQPRYKTVSHTLREVAAKVSILEALKKILSTPEWEKWVHEYFRNRKKEQKQAANWMKLPVLLAVMTVAQATGATTPEQVIDYVKSRETQVQKEVKPSQQDMKQLEDAIPFLVEESELNKLKAPRLVPYRLFKGMLGIKLDKGLKKVMPFMEHHPAFSMMSKEMKARYISDAFINKLNNPQHSQAKGILGDYLESKEESFDSLGDYVENYLKTKTLSA